MASCLHETQEDHTAGTVDGRLVWVCSFCGRKDVWRKGWEWFGAYECKKCSHHPIEKVACSSCPKPWNAMAPVCVARDVKKGRARR